MIRTAAERGAKLTSQLLAFSRKQRLEPQAVDLNSKIVGMRDLLSVTLGGTVQLGRRLAPDLWPALVDPTQIELIVLNLAINARDAMQSGGTLTIETFNAIIEGEPVRPEDAVSGTTMWRWPSTIPASVSQTTCCRACSSPFSPPKNREKARASDWRKCSVLPSNRVAACGSKRVSARALR